VENEWNAKRETETSNAAFIGVVGNWRAWTGSMGLAGFLSTQITQVPPTSPQLPPWKVYKSGTNFRIEKEPGQSTVYMPATNKVYDTFAHPAFCMQLDMDKAKTLSSPLQQAPGASR
jgi:hypothetical protein